VHQEVQHQPVQARHHQPRDFVDRDPQLLIAALDTSSFNGLPQIPFTSFRLSIMPFFFNAPTCGTRDAEAAFGGWSGAAATVTAPYTTTGC
jgi:hypothetical protein